MPRRYLPKDMHQLLHWYERYVSPIALVSGFLADNFILLKRVDFLQTNAILLCYLVVAAVGIVLVHMIEAGKIRNTHLVHASPLILIAMQFAFGGLFSGYLSLYSRSASLAISWIFVFIIAALLLGNERFTRLYARFIFQISLYFTVLFSFLIFFLPVVVHRIGPALFVLSGVTSLFIMTIFLWVLNRIVPDIVRRDLALTVPIVVVIYCLFNALYFSNLIPPLPLALKEAGVYHTITRDRDGTYHLLAEQVPWYESYLRYNTTYHATAGEDVYVYSAIFAPSGLSTSILHEWQYYDDTARAWVTTSILHFGIVGGRDGGYRGYTIKSAPTPGRWRVNVITEYGQLIGRISFTVVASSSTAPLIPSTR
jgi:hypothetical protein